MAQASIESHSSSKIMRIVELRFHGGSGAAPMPSSKEYWQHAQQCLELAEEAEDFYVKSALIELAEKFKKQAEKIKDR
jgi:hypothetical protein